MADTETPTTNEILAARARAWREQEAHLTRAQVLQACAEIGHEMTEYGLGLVEGSMTGPARAVDIAALARIYQVSTDYLLGLCDHPLGSGLHLSDEQLAEIESMMRPGVGISDFLQHVLRTALMVAPPAGERGEDILEKGD